MSRHRREGLGIWLLFYQIFGVIGLDNIPPATLVITAVQVLIYLRIIPVPWHSPSDVCISVDSVWQGKQWKRLLYGAVEHGSDWHLYYNMISFIWKGISLERRFGSARFAYLVSVFTALCSTTLVAVSLLASEHIDRNYFHQCAVGFSAVLFSLKVLTTHYWPNRSHRVMGMPLGLPTRYLVWVELLLIHILVPNSSFLGHLSGILVGLAYLHTPVGQIVDSGWNIIKSVGLSGPQSNRFYSSNRVGRDRGYPRRFVPDGMTEEEQFEFARQESLRSQRSNPTTRSSRSSASYDQQFYRSRPSAPYPDVDRNSQSFNNLPYPPNDPFPPTRNLYPDLDQVRQQRLRRFE